MRKKPVPVPVTTAGCIKKSNSCPEPTKEVLEILPGSCPCVATPRGASIQPSHPTIRPSIMPAGKPGLTATTLSVPRHWASLPPIIKRSTGTSPASPMKALSTGFVSLQSSCPNCRMSFPLGACHGLARSPQSSIGLTRRMQGTPAKFSP